MNRHQCILYHSGLSLVWMVLELSSVHLMPLRSVSGMDGVKIVISAFNVTSYLSLVWMMCELSSVHLMSLRSVSGMDGVRIVISALNVTQVCLWYG